MGTRGGQAKYSHGCPPSLKRKAEMNRPLAVDLYCGLGGWTDAQIVTALTTGKRPDGRELAPIMPWRAFAVLRPGFETPG